MSRTTEETPHEATADEGSVTPAMLKQLESRLMERIMSQLASQGDPKGEAGPSTQVTGGKPVAGGRGNDIPW